MKLNQKLPALCRMLTLQQHLYVCQLLLGIHSMGKADPKYNPCITHSMGVGSSVSLLHSVD